MMNSELDRVRQCTICGKSFTLRQHGSMGEELAKVLPSRKFYPGVMYVILDKCPECFPDWLRGRLATAEEEFQRIPKWKRGWWLWCHELGPLSRRPRIQLIRQALLAVVAGILAQGISFQVFEKYNCLENLSVWLSVVLCCLVAWLLGGISAIGELILMGFVNYHRGQKKTTKKKEDDAK